MKSLEALGSTTQMSFLVGFRTCHVEIIRSLSKSSSSYKIDTYCIVHHQPHDIVRSKHARKMPRYLIEISCGISTKLHPDQV